MTIKTEQVERPDFLRVFKVTAPGEKFAREVIMPKGMNAVMVLAIRQRADGEWVAHLVRETLQPGRYMATGRADGLTFPKGLVDEGEETLEAGAREVGEELGYAVADVVAIQGPPLIAAPGFLAHATHLAVAVLGERKDALRTGGDEEAGAIATEEYFLSAVMQGYLFEGDARHLALVWNPEVKRILRDLGARQ